MAALRDGDPTSSQVHPAPVTLRAPEVDVYRALGATIELLAKRLDVLIERDTTDGLGDDARRTRALTDEVLESLRRMGDEVDERGGRDRLGPGLRRLADDFARATGTTVDVRISGDADILEQELIDVLLGVTCEAFLNIERHGRATVVLISLRVEDDRVVLDMRDDGVDLAQREAYDWRGVSTGVAMATALVASVGGRAAVTPASPRGIRLVAEVPRRVR